MWDDERQLNGASIALALCAALALALATLAWHLRQRDTRRADRLAVEALAVLEATDPGNEQLRARITLSRAMSKSCSVLSVSEVSRAAPRFEVMISTVFLKST